MTTLARLYIDGILVALQVFFVALGVAGLTIDFLDRNEDTRLILVSGLFLTVLMVAKFGLELWDRYSEAKRDAAGPSG